MPQARRPKQDRAADEGDCRNPRVCPSQTEQQHHGILTVRLDFGLGPQDVFDLIGEDHIVSNLQNFAIRSAWTSIDRRPQGR